MSKPTHNQVKQLLSKLVIPFYEIQRDMHTLNLDGTLRSENDAEHSWSVALLGCSLAPHIDPKLDIGLICQFGVVHDLVEVYATDTSVWASDTDLAVKEEKEAEALQKISKNFSHFPWLVETLKAYERQDTNEAIYVRAIDKYIAATMRFLDGGEYYRRNGITKEFFERNLKVHREKAHKHPGVAEYYEKIRAEYDAHPEHFAKP